MLVTYRLVRDSPPMMAQARATQIFTRKMPGEYAQLADAVPGSTCDARAIRRKTPAHYPKAPATVQ